MPGIRERDQNDKIKNRGKRSKPAKQRPGPHRIMTAKLKKLAQQRRGGAATGSTPRSRDSTADSTIEAVEQVEYSTETAVQEVGQQTKHTVSRAVTKARTEHRKRRRRQEQPKEPVSPKETPVPKEPAPTQPAAASPQTPTSIQVKVPNPKAPQLVQSRPPAPKSRVQTPPQVPVPKVPTLMPPETSVSEVPTPIRPEASVPEVPARIQLTASIPDIPAQIRPEPHIPEASRLADTVQPLPQMPPTAQSAAVAAASPPAPKVKPMDVAIKPVQPRTRSTRPLDYQIAPRERRTKAATSSPISRDYKTSAPEYIPEDQPVPRIHKADTPTDPPIPQIRTEAPSVLPTAPTPTPGDRMLQRAMDDRKELARYQERKFDLPDTGEQLAPVHYGKSAVTPEPPAVPKENRSSGNQSIHQSIKERPRRSFVLKEKPKDGTIPPKVRQQATKAAKVTAAPPRSSAPLEKKAAATRMTGRARRKAQREAQRNMLQGTKKASQRAADLSKRAAIAAAKAVKAFISALSALVGGSALLAAFCVIFLVAAVIASPFGILFSNEPSPGAVPLNAAVSQINMELTDKLALLQSGDYDSIDIQGAGPDWREVAAVFACKTTMGADGVDVAVLTPDRVARLKTVFWDMCTITSSVETIDHPATEDTEAWTEKNLHITIAAKTADDMRTAYLFSSDQNRALTELLTELGVLDGLLGGLGVSQEDAIEILQSLPETLPPERRAVVENACKLVGKVNYFWGGKSHVIGWDARWGTLQKVTAAGSPSSGTYRPFGLDCSGFVDWVFNNSLGYIIGHGGGVIMQHRYCTNISQSDAQPGDLAFYPDDSHIGIIVGRNEAGKLLVCHCSSGKNNVVITEFSASGFTAVGRPDIF